MKRLEHAIKSSLARVSAGVDSELPTAVKCDIDLSFYEFWMSIRGSCGLSRRDPTVTGLSAAYESAQEQQRHTISRPSTDSDS